MCASEWKWVRPGQGRTLLNTYTLRDPSLAQFCPAKKKQLQFAYVARCTRNILCQRQQYFHCGCGYYTYTMIESFHLLSSRATIDVIVYVYCMYDVVMTMSSGPVVITAPGMESSSLTREELIVIYSFKGYPYKLTVQF